LLGAVFGFLAIPAEAKAGFLASILGTEAYADVTASQSEDNSQTMALLQANVSSVPIFKDKNNKTDQIDENTSVNIVSDNALLPTASPLDILEVFNGTGNGDFSFDETSVYVVRSGDTISEVADMFGVSVDTILSINEMKKGDSLKEGDVLLILPFSGIEHTVAKGQTLQGIANLYKIEVDEILFANDIDIDAKLAVGEKLMIPGVDMLNQTTPKTKSGTTIKGGGSYSSMPSVVGYFKNPVPGAQKTRGVKPEHKGVDMAAPTGTPIYAAANGTVLIARSGRNGGFGTYVVIQHPNGVKTLYAHMSKLGTTPGTTVSQGQLIGYVGSTGNSTGSHLHFETIGAKNPF